MDTATCEPHENRIKSVFLSNSDNPALHTFEERDILQPCEQELIMNDPKSKSKKNIPKKIVIITNNEKASKDVVARAMAEIYNRMINYI